jgi:hypothetical protein
MNESGWNSECVYSANSAIALHNERVLQQFANDKQLPILHHVGHMSYHDDCTGLSCHVILPAPPLPKDPS